MGRFEADSGGQMRTDTDNGPVDSEKARRPRSIDTSGFSKDDKGLRGEKVGAGDGGRTHDNQLGKLALYH